MRAVTLLRRSLTYYWRTNLAVVAGVAIAVAVLAGALMVGVSVRQSLRDLAASRLGRADIVVSSANFFREALFQNGAPLMVLDGLVTDQNDGRRASHVQVYGVDERFWRFHGIDRIAGPEGTEAYLSESLAHEIAADPGQSVLVRIENASAIPIESLYGRKEDVGRTIRFTVRQILAAHDLGEFSLAPTQGAVRAIFVPLRRLQTTLSQPGRVNALLLDLDDKAGANARESSLADVKHLLHESARLEDLGLRVRPQDNQHGFVLESTSSILADGVVASAAHTAAGIGAGTTPVMTYLANTIRLGDREIPYSVIAGVDLFQNRPADLTHRPMVLNAWAARELNAHTGDAVSIDYYVWETEGRLSTRTTEFQVAGIVPIEGLAADRGLVPDYPGITDSDRLADWDPPFPIDLRRVRPADEDYWKRYRVTPKAFVPFDVAQQLWRSRYGATTSLRVNSNAGTSLSSAMEQFDRSFRKEIDPQSLGFSVIDARAQALTASDGATDFGEYFTYFSMFLVIAALLLAASFFKLGIEQRLGEVGLLQALGLNASRIRGLFIAEGLVLSIAGSLAGAAGAVAYGAAIMFGLRTWWVDAVGTTALRLHVDATSLLGGVVAGILISVVCIWWSLRSLARFSPRALLVEKRRLVSSRMSAVLAGVFGLLAILMIAASTAGRIGPAGGFFGAAASSLVAILFAARAWLRGAHHRIVHGHGWRAVWRLGFRNATWRPDRSVLCIALIAFAVFVIAAVETFKRHDGDALTDRRSGTGGYPLRVDSVLPIVHDLNSAAGREALNLTPEADLNNVRFDRFRVRPGDDTSCLNLYQPKNPRILGASADFLNASRFSFQSSLADTPEEMANPWLLLRRRFADGAVPVITDANSMTYVLHMKLGDEMTLPGTTDRPIRLKLVGALSDSIFQSELVMAESAFVQLFPESEGYRFFLVDVPPGQLERLTKTLETRLSDFGVDVGSNGERLAAFHRVEYTYLSTFQMLGALGLILGTFGLAAVLLRNVLERRRELAVLTALGYRRTDFFAMILAENVFLLVCGLGAGTLCALVATMPAQAQRSGPLPIYTLSLLLLGVLGTGLLASIAATAAALRSPLLPSLRSE